MNDKSAFQDPMFPKMLLAANLYYKEKLSQQSEPLSALRVYFASFDAPELAKGSEFFKC